MYLLGLDIIFDTSNRPHICEVNGQHSGMKGFQEIYGDNRVEERVLATVQEQRPDLFRPWRTYTRRETEHTIGREISHLYFCQLMKEEYNHSQTEVVADNKLLSQMICGKINGGLRLVPGAITGRGFTFRPEIEKMAQSTEKFIVKPVVGSCGNNIEIVNSNDFLERLIEETFEEPYPYFEQRILSRTQVPFDEQHRIVQPFITGEQEEYRCVRAIVLNGEFIDAYTRVSEDPIVNFHRKARAEKFKPSKKLRREIVGFAEQFSSITSQVNIERTFLIGCIEYFEGRGSMKRGLTPQAYLRESRARERLARRKPELGEAIQYRIDFLEELAQRVERHN